MKKLIILMGIILFIIPAFGQAPPEKLEQHTNSYFESKLVDPVGPDFHYPGSDSDSTVSLHLDEQALLELNERVLREYVVWNNTEPLEEIALKDFFAVTPAGIELRAHVIATVDNVDVDSMTVENNEVRIHGEMALLAGTLWPHGRLNGRPMPTLTYLSVYIRQNGHWRLVARSLTPLLVPPQR